MPMPRNNSGDPILASEWNQFADAIDANTAKVSVPAGGTIAQTLVKTSSVDYDTAWSDIPTGGIPAFLAVPEPKPAIASDSSTFGPHTGTSTNRAIPSVTRPYYFPLHAWRGVHIEAVYFIVNSATLGVDSNTVRLSLYENVNGIAGNLLTGFDFASVITSASTTIVEITGLDLDLEAGAYFVRWRTNLDACQLKSMNVVGWNTNSSGAQAAYRAADNASANLPSPATGEAFDQIASMTPTDLFTFRGALL